MCRRRSLGLAWPCSVFAEGLDEHHTANDIARTHLADRWERLAHVGGAQHFAGKRNGSGRELVLSHRNGSVQIRLRVASRSQPNAATPVTTTATPHSIHSAHVGRQTSWIHEASQELVINGWFGGFSIFSNRFRVLETCKALRACQTCQACVTCVSACQPARRFYNHAPKYQNMPMRIRWRWQGVRYGNQIAQ